MHSIPFDPMKNERNPIETILQNEYSMRELEELFLINPNTVHTWMNKGTYTPWLPGNTQGGSQRRGKFLFSALDVFSILAINKAKHETNTQPPVSVAMQHPITVRALDRLRLAWDLLPDRNGWFSDKGWCVELQTDTTGDKPKGWAIGVRRDELPSLADSLYTRVVCPVDALIDHVLEKLATIREGEGLYEDCQHKAEMRLLDANNRLKKAASEKDKAAIGKEIEVLSHALNIKQMDDYESPFGAD